MNTEFNQLHELVKTIAYLKSITEDLKECFDKKLSCGEHNLFRSDFYLKLSIEDNSNTAQIINAGIQAMLDESTKMLSLYENDLAKLIK